MRGIDISEKLPRQVKTLGDMRDSDVRVRVVCARCGFTDEVHVVEFCMLRGHDFSIINKLGNCRAVGCGGRGQFEFSSVGWDQWIPLLTRSFVRGL